MILFNETAERVLSFEQKALKPLLEEFLKTHFLVGGTAIALHLGHRKSIDFDLFTLEDQGTGKELARRITVAGFMLEKGSDLRYLSDEEEPKATLFIRGVKVQLINFNRNPFGVQVYIPHDTVICGGIKTPSLLDLAALKAFAIMYRKKWKDAVDLYFLLHQSDISFSQVIKRTTEIFGVLYQEIATLETIVENQWDTTESVEYIQDIPPSDQEVQGFLLEQAQEYLRNRA